MTDPTLVEALREMHETLAPAARLCYRRTEHGALLWDAREVELIHCRVLAVYGALERAHAAAQERERYGPSVTGALESLEEGIESLRLARGELLHTLAAQEREP